MHFYEEEEAETNIETLVCEQRGLTQYLTFFMGAYCDCCVFIMNGILFFGGCFCVFWGSK